jgi:hypothetical protein
MLELAQRLEKIHENEKLLAHMKLFFKHAKNTPAFKQQIHDLKQLNIKVQLLKLTFPDLAKKIRVAVSDLVQTNGIFVVPVQKSVDIKKPLLPFVLQPRDPKIDDKEKTSFFGKITKNLQEKFCGCFTAPNNQFIKKI